MALRITRTQSTLCSMSFGPAISPPLSTFRMKSTPCELERVATYGALCALQSSKRSFFILVFPRGYLAVTGVVLVEEAYGVEVDIWKPVLPYASLS